MFSANGAGVGHDYYYISYDFIASGILPFVNLLYPSTAYFSHSTNV